jgi:diguanylate cyclase (GGDEF)-like protein
MESNPILFSENGDEEVFQLAAAMAVSTAAPYRPKILIIDDTAGMLRLLKDLLVRNGYEPFTVLSGAEGVTYALQSPPDLILLDIMMPDMDGYEVCAMLKGNPVTRDIPVIFLSALSDVFDKVKAFSVGAVDYINKPFHIEEVLMRVRTHLTIRTLQKSLEDQNAMLVREIDERRRIQEELERIVILDPLTGLYNRRYFFNVAFNEFKKARRYNRPMSVILLDADYFKNVNDTYGHAVGDMALMHLAKIMKNSLRTVDILARYGGEEFIILLPETNLPQTITAAERIREQVESNPLVMNDFQVNMTVSLGISDINSCPNECSFDNLLIFADRALYAAKNAGRNRIATNPYP